MEENTQNYGDDDIEAQTLSSAFDKFVNEEFKRISDNKCSTNPKMIDNNVHSIKVFFQKNLQKQSDSEISLTFILNKKEKELYIQEVNFKVDIWKIYAENEKLTQLVKSNPTDDENEIIKKVAADIYNFMKQFDSTSNPNKKQEFGKAHLHNTHIPYPGFSTCCWSPQGHLITVHNTATTQLKQAKDQKTQFKTFQELNQCVFSQPKKKQSNQMNSRHVVEIKEDEENLQPFFQTGVQLISEKDEEEYDYLNFQFYQHYFPQFHQQEVPKEQKAEKVAFQYRDYEIYDLQNNNDIILGEQFKSLSKRVFETQDKKTVINQNVEISIYDFGSYCYNVDNINQIHEYFVQHMKKNSQAMSSPLRILHQPLDEYFKLFGSSISNFILTSGVNMELQEYNMKLLKILSDCIYNQQNQSAINQEMNLIKDFQEYFNHLWNSHYQIFRFYDQIIYSIKKQNYKDSKKLLECVNQLKHELNLQLKDQIKDLIKEEINKNTIVSNPRPLTQGKECIPSYENLEKRYNIQPIYLLWTKINSFPQISSDRVEFNKLNALKTALRAQSPMNFCIYKKLKSLSFQTDKYINELNAQINGILNLPHINNQKYEKTICCTVCQQPVKGQGLFCSKCQQGGHKEHIERLTIKNICPICKS